MRLTKEEFENSIIAQDDDEDYSESGYVACVFPDGQAALGHYGHCSCYGTFEDLCGGGISDYFSEGDASFTWLGTVVELVALAERKGDPGLPNRAANTKDYDYDHLMSLYEQILEWNKNRA